MSHRPAVSIRRAAIPCLLLALAAGLLIGPAGPASAHNELVSTEPTADAVLDAPPSSLVLEFSEAVLEISPTVVLTGPTGDVGLDAPVVDETLVSVPIPAALAPGGYSVIWRVVSADGHPVQGAFTFTVTAPAATAGAIPTPTDAPTAATTSTPTESATVTPSPTSTSPPGSDGGATSSGAVARTIGVVAVLLALAAAAGAVLARRRR